MEKKKISEKEALDFVAKMGKALDSTYTNVTHVEIRANMKEGKMSFHYHVGISALEVKADG